MADLTIVGTTDVPSDIAVNSTWVELQRLITAREPDGPPCTREPEAWWGEKPAELAYATAACQACLVLEECAAYALHGRERYGVWGGLTPLERRALSGRRR